jgi:CubicO group peptidase (beta-lactamase class C family)
MNCLRRSWIYLLAASLTWDSQGVSAAEPAITAALQPFVENHSLAGAVTLVSSKEKTLTVDVVGFADIAAKKPMTVDSVFWIASMSKPITGAALMILVDEGKLSIDDPVEKYLPEFAGQMVNIAQSGDLAVLKKPARPITIKDVLSHTSGLPHLSRAERQIDMLSLKEAGISYGLTPLMFEPGTKYQYSNAGINTAGRIIEVVSGVPFEQFLDDRIFKLLGMKDTTFWPNEEQLTRLAKSYKPNGAKNDLEETPVGQLTYPLNNRKRGPSPGGGYFSTASDLAVFCRMVMNGGVHDGKRIISEASVRTMTSTQTGDLLNQGKGEHGYGLGWSTSRKANNDSVIPGPAGHGGAHSTNMNIDPQRGLITVWMVQHAGYPGEGGKAQGAFNKAAFDTFAK